MAKRKKDGGQDALVKAIVLATAILNLVRSLIDLFQRLTE